MARPGDNGALARLLAAAEAVFVENGLDRARVEDITARAGISKGAFYLHFESKEGVFRRLIESIIARLAAYVEAAVLENPDDAHRPLRDVFEERIEKEAQLFAFLWEHKGCMRLLFEGGRSTSFVHLIDEFADRMRWRFMGTMRWGVERGIFRSDVDVELASLCVAGAYDRLARHVVRQPEPPDFVALARGVQRLVLSGIADEMILEEIEGRAPMHSQVAFS